MNRLFVFVSVSACCAALAFAQSRGGNWPTFGGDAQRSGWEGTDTRISKDNVKDLQLLFKTKLEIQPKGLRPLMPPAIVQRLISYRGFRELAFVGSNADIVYAVDADLGTIFWQKHLEYSTNDPQSPLSTWDCPGGMTASPTMAVPGAAPAQRGAAPPARGGPAGNAAPAGNGGGFIGGVASVYAISSDGRLHRLNISTGDDVVQPVKVIPSNAKAANLNMVNNVIYTVTSSGCNDTPTAVWAIDMTGDTLKTNSYVLQAGEVDGLAGPVIGNDGTVYLQTGPGANSGALFDPAANKWSNTLLALNAGSLTLKGYFTPTGSSRNSSVNPLADHLNAPSPLVFAYKNRDVIVTTAEDGRLYLVDSASLSGTDHETPLYRTPPLTPATGSGGGGGFGIFGSLTTWQDADGVRWVLAPVWGRLNPDLKAPQTNGPAPNGSIVAFRVEEQAGKTVLTPAWVSHDLNSPTGSVVASGVVFALSAGELTHQVKGTGPEAVLEVRAKGGTRATLFALDAGTGKELYSSRNLVTASAALTGMTVANGRVYFGGTDGTFYAFGMYLER